MTDEFNNNFRLNMETVAFFAGLPPISSTEEAVEEVVEEDCERCGQATSLVEINRNAGICDPCTKYVEST